MADKNTGSAGTLRITATEKSYSAAGNYSDVLCELRLLERKSAPTSFMGGGISASINCSDASGVMGGVDWSGSFGFDWRPSGLQNTLIASKTVRVYHKADGTGAIKVTGAIGDTGTSAAGGPTSVTASLTLKTLKVIPGTPTGVTGTRVSDTSITVAWSQSSASNGQPTQNKIQVRVNGGDWTDAATITAATSTSITVAANQKLEFRVLGSNSAGSSAWSSASAPVYTTPNAPTDVVATRSGANIVVGFTPQAGYSEHSHVVTHGTYSGGVTTWDGSALATLPAGTTSYTHTSPSGSSIHVYKVKAVSTVGSLASSETVSNQVQLIAAPNAPTVATLPAYAAKDLAFVVGWTHNPVDSSPQSAFEVGYSTNGGTTWSSTGKITSATPSRSFSASTWTANTAVVFRVRTWGQATSGGSDSTGASAWSATQTVTFKSRPVATITAPSGSTVTSPYVTVSMGFSQAESATFASAVIQLLQGATVVETFSTTAQTGNVLLTRLDNGGSYTLSVVVRDSNGVDSAAVTKAITVDYPDPVLAGLTATYNAEFGVTQLVITIGTPGGSEVAAVAFTVTREIDGVVEPIVELWDPVASVTIIDTTPTISGSNIYRVLTFSSDGEQAVRTVTVTTSEGRSAFLSKGDGYADSIRFGGDLEFDVSPSLDSTLVKAAGRDRPIGLYARTGNLVVSGSSTITPLFGSSADDIEEFLLIPGRVCYRDPSGRRMFGQLAGSLSRSSPRRGVFSYTVTETSS